MSSSIRRAKGEVANRVRLVPAFVPADADPGLLVPRGGGAARDRAADVAAVTVTDARFAEPDFPDREMTDADLTDADLTDADLTDAD